MAGEHLPVPMDDQINVRRAAEYEAADCVAIYAMAQDTVDLTIVGTGEYALVAVLSDGTRRIKFMGFATNKHAEIFARYAEACNRAAEEQRLAAEAAAGRASEPVEPAGAAGGDAPPAEALPRRIMLYGKVYALESAGEQPADRPRILHFEVAALVPVLDQRLSDRIEHLFTLAPDAPRR